MSKANAKRHYWDITKTPCWYFRLPLNTRLTHKQQSTVRNTCILGFLFFCLFIVVNKRNRTSCDSVAAVPLRNSCKQTTRFRSCVSLMQHSPYKITTSVRVNLTLSVRTTSFPVCSETHFFNKYLSSPFSPESSSTHWVISPAWLLLPPLTLFCMISPLFFIFLRFFSSAALHAIQGCHD